MKIKETKISSGMAGSGKTLYRIRVLDVGETVPAGAIEVPEETPVSDWKEEGE